MTEIVVVDSGSGNLRSVENALRHVGARVRVSGLPEDVAAARALVVPGQGAFGDGMAALTARGLDGVLRAAFARGVPTFGICLGLQLLFEGSDEAPGVAGLGVLAGRVRRFAPTRHEDKVPHMGWNDVAPPAGAAPDPLWPVGAREHVYFVHSFYADPLDRAHVALECDYAGVRFCAAVRAGSVFATQFHPEKSQRVGLGLLSRFVRSLPAVTTT